MKTVLIAARVIWWLGSVALALYFTYNWLGSPFPAAEVVADGGILSSNDDWLMLWKVVKWFFAFILLFAALSLPGILLGSVFACSYCRRLRWAYDASMTKLCRECSVGRAFLDANDRPPGLRFLGTGVM